MTQDFFLYEHQDNKRIDYVISYDGDKINTVSPIVPQQIKTTI